MIVMSKKYFEDYKKETIATIVGRERKTRISLNKFLCDFKVIIPEISEEYPFLCNTPGKGLDPEDFPVGTKIRIEYALSPGDPPFVRAYFIEKISSEAEP